MFEQNVAVYRCPYSQSPLNLEKPDANQGEVKSGMLTTAERKYLVKNGIPELISESDEHWSDDEKKEFNYYETTSDGYDSVMDWLFECFYESEDEVREKMLSLLNIQPADKVLETGCGTCRDSIRIVNKLGKHGQLFLQDLSPRMLEIGRKKIEALKSGASSPAIEYFIGNATRLPFPDGYFDSAFHFGGLNLFSDKKLAIAEMARVVRVGGRVVFGDEGLGSWLRETTYGKILLNSNQLYKHSAPLELLPENALDVCARWILGNSFYLVDFTVGNGHPKVNFDLPIQGKRGGTHRSRYFGVLEGVTPATKELAEKARQKTGLNAHDWIEQAVREKALKDTQSLV
jgi:SAM-dependent methyltransferase